MFRSCSGHELPPPPHPLSPKDAIYDSPLFEELLKSTWFNMIDTRMSRPASAQLEANEDVIAFSQSVRNLSGAKTGYDALKARPVLNSFAFLTSV